MATNKTVFFLIGILLIVLGASMLAPYLIQVLYGENSHSFISSSFVTIFIGILFIMANLEKEFKFIKAKFMAYTNNKSSNYLKGDEKISILEMDKITPNKIMQCNINNNE